MSSKEERFQDSSEAPELRRAYERVKKAHDSYSRFVATTPLTSAEVPVHDLEEMRAAQEEVQSAEDELNRLYAERLRRDSEFLSKSQEAETNLKKGPPWDNEFSPINTSMNSDRSDE